LDACPTNAFPQPGVLDATRCISYLTIELKKPIPRALRSDLQDWIFGCDICQDVCPWNRKAPPGGEPELLSPPGAEPQADLLALLRMTPESFRRQFRDTAIWRTKRRGLLRNAALVLGNQRDPRAIPVLRQALEDEEPLVRGAAAWALGQFGANGCPNTLQARLAVEIDPDVRQEIKLALESMQTGIS
jgi:epoxyqueuosine reductase